MSQPLQYVEVTGLDEINEKARLGWRVVSAERDQFQVNDHGVQAEVPGEWVALMECPFKAEPRQIDI